VSRKILVVEDVEDSRSILVITLERAFGYETLEAATGREAIEKALAEKPDLILMDLGLPDMPGVDAAKAIRQNPSTAHIPIIAHTAWTLSGTRDAALEIGMVEYLEKPVPKEVLKKTVSRFVQPEDVDPH
jgi:CheY-like chemotaxis protein